MTPMYALIIQSQNMRNELLLELKGLLTPETWCVGAGSRNIAGKQVPIIDDSAVTFDLYARICLMRGGKVWKMVFPWFRDTVGSTITFNDTHTLEEIHQMINELIIHDAN